MEGRILTVVSEISRERTVGIVIGSRILLRSLRPTCPFGRCQALAAAGTELRIFRILLTAMGAVARAARSRRAGSRGIVCGRTGGRLRSIRVIDRSSRIVGGTFPLPWSAVIGGKMAMPFLPPAFAVMRRTTVGAGNDIISFLKFLFAYGADISFIEEHKHHFLSPFSETAGMAGDPSTDGFHEIIRKTV